MTRVRVTFKSSGATYVGELGGIGTYMISFDTTTTVTPQELRMLTDHEGVSILRNFSPEGSWFVIVDKDALSGFEILDDFTKENEEEAQELINKW